MKTLFGCGIGFGAISMVLFCGVANAQTMLVNDFGDGVQSWRFDYGGPSSTLSQDPTEGSPDNAAGALRMDMGFAPSNNRNDYAFTGDVFFPATDLTGFDALEFDLKIADGAALDAFGNHGFFRFQSRETDGYSGNSVVSGNLAPETGFWKSYSVSTETLLATRAFTFYLYGGPSQNIDGDITIFLDNIRLTTAVPEPTALAMAALLAGTGLGFRRR